jgi:hypothetical protein
MKIKTNKKIVITLVNTKIVTLKKLQLILFIKFNLCIFKDNRK